MRENLISKTGDGSGTVLVNSMDDWYKKQKDLKQKDRTQLRETKQTMTSFRGDFVAEASQKVEKKQPTSLFGGLWRGSEQEADPGAANRAAAAIYGSSGKKKQQERASASKTKPGNLSKQQKQQQQKQQIVPDAKASTGKNKTAPKKLKRKEMPLNGGKNPGVVTSLDDFYKMQSSKRQQETVERRQQTSRMEFHSFSGLVINNAQKRKPHILDILKTEQQQAQEEEKVADVVLPEEDEVTPIDEDFHDDPVHDDVSVDSDPPNILIDTQKHKYRAFVFVVHQTHGLLLLHCTRKASKGPHFQLPGGHVDDADFWEAARQQSQDAQLQLLVAAQIGASRELWEETGIDIRNDAMLRLEPASLRVGTVHTGNDDFILPCENKKRLYFFLQVTDSDFCSDGNTSPMPDTFMGSSSLKLQLSHEHQGWMFESNPAKSATLLEKHSGGKGSEALRMAMVRDVKEEEIGVPPMAPEATSESLELEVGDDETRDLLPPPPKKNIFDCFCVKF